MQLSKEYLKNIKAQKGLTIPAEELLELPERVLQFGTGVLLRGLPDYFIDKANRQGIFNGRIVVVKSTSTGGTDEFKQQDNLYTVCVRGIEKGEKIDEAIINSSISRVLSANEEWAEILKCAHDPNMQIIISNTTEVGITLVQDDISSAPPVSFPGKLLAFLHERFTAFNGSAESGMIIIPTELISENGAKLRAIIFELAKQNNLDDAFNKWLETSNHFCNSLVDRIVPGKLRDNELRETEEKLGYKDSLLILAECFRLWAIESSNEKVKEKLSFSQADEGVVIAPDIEKFKELKLRLLNGTHSFSCGLAHLAGFPNVRAAMDDELFASFVYNLANQDIAAAISNGLISEQEARDFAASVLDRFRNPSLDHRWISIAVQYSSKMKMRNIPILLKHYTRSSQVPEYMAMGFAAYLLFMKSKQSGNKFIGQHHVADYEIQDEHAAWLSGCWSDNDPGKVVDNVLRDEEFWGINLNELEGFASAVKTNLQSLIQNGAMDSIRRIELNKTTA